MQIINRMLTKKFVKLFLNNTKNGVHKVIYYNKPDENGMIEVEIVFTDEENKIFKKLKDLSCLDASLSLYFNIVDENNNIYKTKNIKYFSSDDRNKFKTVIQLINVKLFINKKDENNKVENEENKNDVENEETVNKNMKTTTQKYLNMNSCLLRLRDAIFDPDVINEAEEDEETEQKVIKALDVICHYLDDYKEMNGVRTRIKE